MRRAILLVSVLALALASCSEGESGERSGSTDPTGHASAQTTTPEPSASAPTATATAPGDPVVHGPTAFVTSQEVCTLSDEVRGLTCEDTSNDPRVAGTARYILHQSRWGDAGNGALVQWGAARITNSGGAWVGRFEGVYTSETGDTVTSLLVGSGDYAGLSYYRWEYKTFGLTWQTEGLIFPGTIPSH
jgi:hypothetical protein